MLIFAFQFSVLFVYWRRSKRSKSKVYKTRAEPWMDVIPDPFLSEEDSNVQAENTYGAGEEPPVASSQRIGPVSLSQKRPPTLNVGEKPLQHIPALDHGEPPNEGDASPEMDAS